MKNEIHLPFGIVVIPPERKLLLSQIDLCKRYLKSVEHGTVNKPVGGRVTVDSVEYRQVQDQLIILKDKLGITD